MMVMVIVIRWLQGSLHYGWITNFRWSSMSDVGDDASDDFWDNVGDYDGDYDSCNR
jgi:hypothetical protein